MTGIRKIEHIQKSRSTVEGAGVNLNRVFAHQEVKMMDPFLLLDDFRSDDPDDYISGFPWHPHRGIETVTYMLQGKMRHGDSIGNAGVIESGDVQWMTAGSGIIHEEMPEQEEGALYGFQLWVNLPATNKMSSPRYQEFKSSLIPSVELGNYVKVKVICGEYEDKTGPVKDITVDALYLDVEVPSNSEFTIDVIDGYTAFAYLYEGNAFFTSLKPEQKNTLVVYERQGDKVKITTGETPARFLFISGKPLNESIAWYGPIVMNTKEELEVAIREYNEGAFVK